MEVIADLGEANRCIRELAALSLLPVIWSEGRPSQIRDNLADALENSLRADVVYVRCRGEQVGSADSAVRCKNVPQADKILESLEIAVDEALGRAGSDLVEFGWHDLRLRLAVIPLGPGQEFGALAVGSRRGDFPTPLERILLNVSINQAIIAFRSAKRMIDLRRSESNLRDFVENATVGLHWVNADGTIIWANQSELNMLGYSRDEYMGRNIAEFHADGCVIQDILSRLTSGETLHDYAASLRCKDGSIRPVLIDSNVLFENGKFIHTRCFTRDIGNQKLAEIALRDESRILEILNKTGTAIAANLDLQTLVQTVTDSATELSGAKFGAFFYNQTNEQGESFLLYTLSGAPREAFERFGQPRATPLFAPTFRGEGVIRSDDVSKDPRYGHMSPHYGMPNGHLPVRSYLAVPVTSRTGEVLGGLFFGHPEPNVFTDRSERLITGVAAQAAVAIDNARLYDEAQKEIAQRRHVEEALRASERKLAAANAELDQKVQERTASLQQANAQMEEFSYSVSHDLRAPLRAIEAYSRFLQEDHSASLDPEAQKYVAKISRNIGQMNRLINGVLTLSRISRSELQPVPVLVQPLIEEIVEQNPHMQPPHAEIEIHASERVLGDEVSLSQAISNLLSNAVKFVPADVKPRVKVWSEPRGDQVRLWFEDNGIGIKPEHQEKLFGMFQRLNSDPIYEGTGVGLAIVRKAVGRIGGTVGVESDGVCGSKFWIDVKKA